MPTDIAKIQSHKFGRRSLTSKSAWYRYNKLVQNEDNADVIRNIATDAKVVEYVGKLNQKLHDALNLVGFTGDSTESVIVLAAPDKMFIPWRVWRGEIPLGYTSVPGASRQTFDLILSDFADNAGLLRQRIAVIMHIVGLQNDFGNVDQKPNVGGVVKGEKHEAGQ